MRHGNTLCCISAAARHWAFACASMGREAGKASLSLSHLWSPTSRVRVMEPDKDQCIEMHRCPPPVILTMVVPEDTPANRLLAKN